MTLQPYTWALIVLGVLLVITMVVLAANSGDIHDFSEQLAKSDGERADAETKTDGTLSQLAGHIRDLQAEAVNRRRDEAELVRRLDQLEGPPARADTDQFPMPVPPGRLPPVPGPQTAGAADVIGGQAQEFITRQIGDRTYRFRP